MHKNTRKKSTVRKLVLWYGAYSLIILFGAYLIANTTSKPVKHFTKQQTTKIQNKPASKSYSSYIITTIAGTGEAGYSGDNGLAINAKINIPYGIAVSPQGTLYIADRYNHRIRKIEPNGIISTFAGNGSSQNICTNEPALGAYIPSPEKIALAPDGSLYISSSADNRVRKIDNLGIVKAIAGTGDHGYNMDGIIATSSQLNAPSGIAIDQLGNLYIADTLNHRIRKIDPTGIITTIAGIGKPGFSGDNGIATKARIDSPSSVAITSDGSVYFAHGVNPRIRKISPQGKIITIAGTGVTGLVIDGEDAMKTELGEWISLSVGPDDTLYIVNHKNNQILHIDDKGRIEIIAGTGISGFNGDDEVATRAMLAHPTSISIASDNIIYIADADNNRIRKLTPVSRSTPQ